MQELSVVPTYVDINITNSSIVSVDHYSFHTGMVAFSRAVLPVGSIRLYHVPLIYLPVFIDNLHGRKQVGNLQMAL